MNDTTKTVLLVAGLVGLGVLGYFTLGKPQAIPAGAGTNPGAGSGSQEPVLDPDREFGIGGGNYDPCRLFPNSVLCQKFPWYY